MYIYIVLPLVEVQSVHVHVVLEAGGAAHRVHASIVKEDCLAVEGLRHVLVGYLCLGGQDGLLQVGEDHLVHIWWRRSLISLGLRCALSIAVIV